MRTSRPSITAATTRSCSGWSLRIPRRRAATATGLSSTGPVSRGARDPRRRPPLRRRRGRSGVFVVVVSSPSERVVVRSVRTYSSHPGTHAIRNAGVPSSGYTRSLVPGAPAPAAHLLPSKGGSPCLPTPNSRPVDRQTNAMRCRAERPPLLQNQAPNALCAASSENLPLPRTRGLRLRASLYMRAPP